MPKPNLTKFYLKHNRNYFLLVSCIYIVVLGMFLSLLHVSNADTNEFYSHVTKLNLVDHYIIILTTFLLSFVVIDFCFMEITWRYQTSRSFILLKSTLQTSCVAAAMFIHIHLLEDFALHHRVFFEYLYTHHYLIASDPKYLKEFLISQAYVLIMLAFILSFLTYLVLFLCRSIGPDYIINLLSNRYQKPVWVDKVIMYLDINDSTQLNEAFGNEKFLAFEQEFFKDIAAAIFMTSGSVYEYAGDEVLVLWSMKDGVSNNNCIKIVDLIEQSIHDKKDFYLQKFGVVPTFKASLHCGELVMGVKGLNEILVKYVGSPLNTGARIIGQCHNVGKRLLISSTLKDLLPNDNSIYYEFHGHHSFKGLTKPLGIYSIDFI